ncbi:hypothetical protein GCM10027051_20760 [Niabella terrae]
MLQKLALLSTGITLSLFASAQAFEGKVRYGKTDEPAIVMVYNYPPEVVESALNAKLTDKRLKGNRSRGFDVYTNAVIDDISQNALDYSFKLESAGNRSAEKTTLYMVMQASGPVSNPADLAKNGKAFLEELAPWVKKSHKIIEIKKQETILVDEETKLLELQKAAKELEQQLEKNRQQQQTQQRIISSQQAMLDDLKSNS